MSEPRHDESSAALAALAERLDKLEGERTLSRWLPIAISIAALLGSFATFYLESSRQEREDVEATQARLDRALDAVHDAEVDFATRAGSISDEANLAGLISTLTTKHRALVDEALAISRQLDPEDLTFTQNLILSGKLAATGRNAEALALGNRALEIAVGDFDTAVAEQGVAAALMAPGPTQDLGAARTFFRRSVDRLLGHPDPYHVGQAGFTLEVWAQSEFATGHPAEALLRLDEAQEVYGRVRTAGPEAYADAVVRIEELRSLATAPTAAGF